MAFAGALGEDAADAFYRPALRGEVEMHVAPVDFIARMPGDFLAHIGGNVRVGEVGNHRVPEGAETKLLELPSIPVLSLPIGARTPAFAISRLKALLNPPPLPGFVE